MESSRLTGGQFQKMSPFVLLPDIDGLKSLLPSIPKVSAVVTGSKVYSVSHENKDQLDWVELA